MSKKRKQGRKKADARSKKKARKQERKEARKQERSVELIRATKRSNILGTPAF